MIIYAYLIVVRYLMDRKETTNKKIKTKIKTNANKTKLQE